MPTRNLTDSLEPFCQCARMQRFRVGPSFRIPDPLERELEIGELDATPLDRLAVFVLRAELCDQRLSEVGIEHDRWLVAFVPLDDRLLDRLAHSRLIEMAQLQRGIEQAG